MSCREFYPEMIYPKDVRRDGLLKSSALKRIEKARAKLYPNARSRALAHGAIAKTGG